MKKRDLEAALRSLGWFPIREGGNHTIWGNGKGETTQVGRHTEINEFTALGTIAKARRFPG